MTTTTDLRVTKKQQQIALREVAKWLGPRMGCIRPCGKCAACENGIRWEWECERPKSVPAPTGIDAAHIGEGPMLNPEWDWPSDGPTPTILLEGGPHEWALDISVDPDFCQKMNKIGVFAEPYAGYALCLHREW